MPRPTLVCCVSGATIQISPKASSCSAAAHKPGDVIPITFESRGATLATTVTLTASPRLEIVPFEVAGEAMTDEVRAFRAAWLGAR